MVGDPPSTLPVEVRRMFSAIARRYDLLNHLLSLNRDRAWRRAAVNELAGNGPITGTFLDACAGTFDMAIELATRTGFGGTVLAFDFAFAMLHAGRAKLTGRRILPGCADALNLPLSDASVDGAMVAFGVRNLSDADAGLRELGRVVRPGGTLVILEFTTPQWRPFRAIYLWYFRSILPRIGRLISRHASAYSYLPASVLAFPDPPELARRLSAAGFTRVRWQPMTGGIVAIHVAERAASPVRSAPDASAGEGL